MTKNATSCWVTKRTVRPFKTPNDATRMQRPSRWAACFNWDNNPKNNKKAPNPNDATGMQRPSRWAAVRKQQLGQQPEKKKRVWSQYSNFEPLTVRGPNIRTKMQRRRRARASRVSR